MVAYEHDSNTIHPKPMKNRSGPDLLKSYTAIHNLLSERGLARKMYYLDNECPTVLQKFMTAKDERFQLVPPHLHIRNSAERAIQKFKNHFIAGLASVKKIPRPSLVQVATALPTHLEPSPSVTDQPKTLRLRPAPRHLQLQPHDISAAWHKNHHPR